MTASQFSHAQVIARASDVKCNASLVSIWYFYDIWEATMTTTSTIAPTGLAIPSLTTLKNLAIGGVAGLFLWEIFARVVTKAILGYPLEPAGLIDAIAQHQFGLSVNYWVREALHYGVGILGYPIAFYVISRMLPRWSSLLDGLTLLTFTIAVGFHFKANGFSSLVLGFWFLVLALTMLRFLYNNQPLVSALSWGAFTWLNALCIMAPLGGLSFYLLGEGGDLSLMSYIGHVIYGAVAVLVFNALNQREA
jgi:hypothetical protein